MNTGDDFHIYRLVRRENDHYVHLFVDDAARPAIVDFPMSGVQMNGARAIRSRVILGFVSGQVFPRYRELPDNTRVREHDHRMNALVDYLRWAPRVE